MTFQTLLMTLVESVTEAYPYMMAILGTSFTTIIVMIIVETAKHYCCFGEADGKDYTIRGYRKFETRTKFKKVYKYVGEFELKTRARFFFFRCASKLRY